MYRARPYFRFSKAVKETEQFRGVDDVEVPRELSDLVDVYSYITRAAPVSGVCGCGHSAPQAIDYDRDAEAIYVRYRCLSCGAEYDTADVVPEYGDLINLKDKGET